MCGIVGIASAFPVKERGLLVRQRDTMVHRGPDWAGVWWSPDGRVGLAHRRLAIIDLSPAGRQPMLDPTERLCVTFNGEIYNHRELRRDLEGLGRSFRSASDTEVILEAYSEWGTDCLDRFNGMFAFALYDTEKRLLFMARDRAGEKPLFYRYQPGNLCFASELKALLADPNIPRKLNLEALTFYLTFGYVPGHRCLLEGFCKLPPAHAAIFDLETGDLHRWQYWELPSGPVDGLGQPVDGEQLAEELGHLLGDSVRRQLVADVPVGVLLSGGIDSSLVTAMAAKNTQSLKTFTITFPDYGPYDEAPHARLIAEQFATEHVELVAEPSTIDLLPELARQFDEPIVDSSMIPTYLVSCLVREHCTVALGGDGGDELFGGYEHYSQLLKMNRRIGWVPRRLRAAAASLAQALLPVGLPGRNLVMRMTANFDNGFSETARLFDFTSRRKLLSDEVTKTIDDRSMLEELSARLSQSGDGIVDKAQRLDFQTYLPEDILVKVDRTSMLNSLEVRAPLLDYRIIEFAFGRIPPVLKVGPNNKKILLKMLGKRVLPSSFHTERKQGFSVPLADWLRKEWRVPFAALLLDRSTALWKRSEIERIWKNHCRGFSNSERLFGIVMFELWRNHYRISL